MDDKFDEAEFWLPSEFLTDEDIVMDNSKDRFGQLKSNFTGFRFPAAFPYDYGPPALGSPVDSLGGSAETECSDEEDFLVSGLTCQLTLRDVPKFIPAQQSHEKANVVSGSPQSTLTKVGSWSGRSSMSSNGSPNGPSQVSSPPTTPLASENDPWELIYQAAGQIARLKMSKAEGFNSNPRILGPPKRIPTPPPHKNASPACLYSSPAVKQDASVLWSSDLKNRWSYDSQEILPRMGGRVGVSFGQGLSQSPCVWESQQRDQLFGDLGVKGGAYAGVGFGYGFGYGCGSGGGVGGGGGSGGLKRQRAGTGVFLPRRYENNNYNCKASESRKKPGFSPAMVPNRVAPTLNKSAGDVHGILLAKSRYNCVASIGDYDASLLARRNVLLAQQRRSLCPEVSMSHEICLPQEWTY